MVRESKKAQKQKAKAAVADLKNKLKKGEKGGSPAAGATGSDASSTTPAAGGSSAGTTPSAPLPAAAGTAPDDVDADFGSGVAGAVSLGAREESGEAAVSSASAAVVDGSYVTVMPQSQVDSSYLTLEPQPDVTDAKVTLRMRMESVDLSSGYDNTGDTDDVSGELHDIDLDGDISGGGGLLQEIDLS